MADLTRFVHYACGLINFDEKSIDDLPQLMESFVKFCDSYSKITKYYLIAHTETNVLHIHFIFYSISQVQLMTYFNKMRSWFVPKFTRDEYGINISKCESINAHLKYLIHQDKTSLEEGKKPYSVEDFVSNDEVEVIDTLIQSRKGAIDAYMLRNAVLDNIDDFSLMVALTLPVFHKYRYEIEILKSNRASLALDREKEKKELLEGELPF